MTSPQDWQEARDAAVDSGSDGPYDPHARRLDDFDQAVTDALNILDDDGPPPPPPPPRLEVRCLTAGGYAVWCWDCHRWLLDGQTTPHGPVVASWVSGHEMAHEMQVTR